jgi:acetyl/propionyl-CoA carboxylase alpha subunit
VKGITTNTAYLGRVLDLEEFRKGDYDTGLLARAQDRLLRKEKTGDEEIALAAAAIWQCEQDQRAALRQTAAKASDESAWGRAGRLASLRRSR